MEDRRSCPFGNVASALRNAGGPSVTNIALSLMRNIRSHDKWELQIRGESSNLLNVLHF